MPTETQEPLSASEIAELQAIIQAQPPEILRQLLGRGPMPPPLTRLNGEPAQGVGPSAGIPRPVNMAQLRANPPPRPEILVHGVMHKSAKTIIIGGSKAFKTWSFLDLAVSVAAGVPWWGFETEKGRVLYINFEIHDGFFVEERFPPVCEAKGLDERAVTPNFDYHGLRGHGGKLDTLTEIIIEASRAGRYSMIVIDPLYKCLGDRDENSAGDMASLMNVLDKISAETGCAVVFGHHFSKGNQSGKDMIDRGAGSGVMGRDPDSIITMTPHEEEDAFTVEMKLRNLPPVSNFVVRRQHPLMVRDESLRPEELRRPARGGRPRTDHGGDLLAMLADGPLLYSEWLRIALAADISESTFKRRRRELEGEGAVRRDEDGRFHRVEEAPGPVLAAVRQATDRR